MDIFTKHYEKIILIICLVLMVLGLVRVADLVTTAKQDEQKDKDQKANYIDKSAGEFVPDFDPSIFNSKEGWIQRIKDKTQNEVIGIATAKVENGKTEDVTVNWDRRYFDVLTKHSNKPIELAEAEYRLEKNKRELVMLTEERKKSQETLAKYIKTNGENDNDERLDELKTQLENYSAALANVEVNIVELNKRIKYLGGYTSTQGSMVDPQELVCCPNPACGSLILSKEDVCPFCRKKLPEVNPAEDEEGVDTDGDGMPDSFEKAHAQRKSFSKKQTPQNAMGNNGMMDGGMMDGPGMQSSEKGVLNYMNAQDANEDFDGDSFTNFEEYRFGTDIDDENSFPDPANFIRVVEFEQEKVPLKFMGVNDGKAPKEQKKEKWRAKIAFQMRSRGRTIWAPEANWEQVRIGKRIDCPDGKQFVLEDIEETEVDGEKHYVATIKEYQPPKRAARPKIKRKGDENEVKEPEPEVREPQTFVMKEDEEAFFDIWYANIMWMPSRNASMFSSIFYNRYIVSVKGRPARIQTRFRLKEGEKIKIQVPFAIKQKEDENAPKKKQPRLLRGGMDPNMNGGMGMDMGMGMDSGMGMNSYVQLEIRDFEYKITGFNKDEKNIVLTPITEEAKDVKPVTVPIFNEDEVIKLPSGSFNLIYSGSMNGMDGGMMDGGMMDAPGMMPGRR